MNITTVDINTLIPYARNPRKNKAAIDVVASSIKEFGFQQPIVVDKDMVIIVGHTRWEAAKKLKLTQVPIHIADTLTDAQCKAYRLMDNRSNENAEWDYDLLKLELQDLDELINLNLTGFTEEEVQELIGDKGRKKTDDPDDVPELEDLPLTPISQQGDVWILGQHKVTCGDSTHEETYKALLKGDRADLVWTDPPYNVNYTSAAFKTTSKSKKFNNDKLKHDKIANDSMDSESFYHFLHDVFTPALSHTKKGGIWYIAHSDQEGLNFRRAATDAGLEIKQLLIWVKNTFTLTMKDYQSQMEPILYLQKPGAKRYFVDDRTKRTVIDDRDELDKMTKDQLLEFIKSIPVDIIDCNKPTKNDLHPTMKPVKLIEQMVNNSSLPGEIVLDMFGGSGSTLLACETTKRKARLIELEPKYIDVIIQRWQDFTGLQGVLESTGKTYDQMKEIRNA